MTAYQRGHVTNVRRGKGESDGYVIADLMITDRDLIEKVNNGLRDCSVGYECEWVEEADGTYSQRNTRANHLAIVEKGRAGERVRIKDYNRADTYMDQCAFEEAAARYHRKRIHVHSDRERSTKTAFSGTVEMHDSTRDIDIDDLRANEAADFEARARRAPERQMRQGQ